jgi:hypothetical protein
MTIGKAIRSTAVVALLGAVTVSAQQDIRITQEVMTTNPLGGPGPGGGLNPIPQGTGLILGQVVEAGSSRPIPGALVTLNLRASRPIRALADGQGRFVFRDLPEGNYNMTATKPGHVDGAYGRLRPSGPTLPLELGDGERASSVSIAVWRYAAIAGFVQDELGEPVVNTAVRVLRRQIIGGQWRFVAGAQDQTDDRGAYRIGTLEPGEYAVAVAMAGGSGLPIDMMMGAELDRMVSVSAVRVAGVAGGGGESAIFFEGSGGDALGVDENGRAITYPTQFFSGAGSAVRATLVKLGSGEERGSVDFQLKPVRAFKISGAVSGPEGPLGNLALTLVPAEAEQLASAFDTRTSFASASGTFTFTGIPPGQYVLRATRTPRMAFGGPMETTVIQQGGATITTSVGRGGGPGMPPLPTEPTLWTEVPVTVSTTDIVDLPVMLRPGLRVTGTVQFDGGAARPEGDRLTSVGVMLEPADVRPGVNSARGRVETSGQFATMGVPPGRYFVRAQGAPQGWTFRGATLGGRDVTDTPLDIDSEVSGVALVFTDRPIELSGRVTGDASLTEGATVILFPTDQSAWVGYGSTTRRLRNVRADKTGAFTIGNLPAGDYYLAAVTEKIAVDWQNPEFLASLTSDATRVRLSDGQKLTQNVKVAR